MRDVLHKTMSHKHIRGKPLLIIANKQDIIDSIDVVDITYFFEIDEMCNKLGSPCLIITSGENSRSELSFGIKWIVRQILTNYKTIKNRMRFNCLPLTPLKKINRLRTSFTQKVRWTDSNNMNIEYNYCNSIYLFDNVQVPRISSTARIRSAPSTFALKRSPQIDSTRFQTIEVTELSEKTRPTPYTHTNNETRLFRLNPIIVKHE